MTDLNVMMRDQARNGLLSQLDKATVDGDAEAARKITADLEKLAVSTAPKAPPFGDVEIKAQLEKAPWFGIDPKKSAKVIEFGKTMDPKKFATAELFAAALIKAVDEEFKPARAAGAAAEDEGTETDEEREEREETERAAAEAGPGEKKPRKTDGPGEADTGVRSRRAAAGPWKKMSDAPADVQKEINRTADKFVSAHAPKEQREKYISNALESHYAAAQRNKGKK